MPNTTNDLRFDQELEERPSGYQGPNLSPRGLAFQPRQLGPGVWALLANLPPKDNNGLLAGDHAALVVDAGINSAVAQAAIAWMVGYLERLLASVTELRGRGFSLEETLDACPLPQAPAQMMPTRLPDIGRLNGQMHRLNVLAVYRALEQAPS
jgi:hypothetical protein